jgi:NADH-quinone oxidoreductase subunit E
MRSSKAPEVRVSAADAAVGDETRRRIDEIVDRWSGKPGALLGILEDAQDGDAKRWLPEPTLRYIADKTGTALSRIYSTVTFYSFFNLKPQGEHSIVVCRGTACHTRGSRGILLDALSKLGAVDFREEDENSFTTEDARFTVRTVACFGQCALSPVVAVDGVIHSRMTSGKLLALVSKIGKGGAK